MGGAREEGILLKAYGGFYFVQAGGKVLECRLRGRHRQDRKKEFLPGDRVLLSGSGDGGWVVEELLPRSGRLLRPPVANVDLALLVMSLANPRPDLELLDRLLVLTGQAGVDQLICFNKADLLPEGKNETLAGLYREAGYTVLTTSARTGRGLEDLRLALRQRIAVLAGPSGVGKSSLLNALQEGFRLKTAEVSAKGQRGRHTTRHVELLPLEGGGMVADAPGFTRLDLPEIPRGELAFYFPELLTEKYSCRFRDCLHRSEPGCTVREAVERGEIQPSRYRHYLSFLEEIMARERSGN